LNDEVENSPPHDEVENSPPNDAEILDIFEGGSFNGSLNGSNCTGINENYNIPTENLVSQVISLPFSEIEANSDIGKLTYSIV